MKFNKEVQNLDLWSDILRASSAELTHTGTCKNGADRGFPCSIVSQENSDLSLIQVHAQIFDCYAFTPSPIKHLWESQGVTGRVTPHTEAFLRSNASFISISTFFESSSNRERTGTKRALAVFLAVPSSTPNIMVALWLTPFIILPSVCSKHSFIYIKQISK